MLLAADVGNTEIVLGVFRGPELVHTWRVSTQAERTADELALLLSVELCSLTLQRGDLSVANLIASGLSCDVRGANAGRASRNRLAARGGLPVR